MEDRMKNFIHIYISQFSLFAVLMVYEVPVNTELANIEPPCC